jgi:nitroreductase
MDLDKAIQSRRSIRKYKSKKPNWRDILECIDAARYAPTAGGMYTLKFILVGNPEKIQKMAAACQQSFIAQAQFIVVVCSNPARLLNSYKEKGEMFFRQQAGAAIQNFLLKITEKGLGACWVGYYVEEQIKEIMKIPEGTVVEAIIPIGYEFEKPKTRKEKIDLRDMTYFEWYGNKKIKEPKEMHVDT